MCVVVRMARIAGKENLFEVATCRLLNFGSPDFSNATTFPPQEKDDCNRKAEGSYQAPRTGIESSPRGRRRPHTPRGGRGVLMNHVKDILVLAVHMWSGHVIGPSAIMWVLVFRKVFTLSSTNTSSCTRICSPAAVLCKGSLPDQGDHFNKT